MIEGIRTQLMHKWAESENRASKWKGTFTPACMQMFEDNRFLAMNCGVEWNGDDGYEVTEGSDKHVVFIDRKSCSCRIWDLTGIPCQHAICALHQAKIDPSTQVHRYYHKATYLAGYRTKFQPIRGEAFWQKSKFKPLEPPPEITLPGRPNKKKRDRSAYMERYRKAKQLGLRSAADVPPEALGNLNRLSEKKSQMTCSKCHQEGHNARTCTQVCLPLL